MSFKFCRLRAIALVSILLFVGCEKEITHHNTEVEIQEFMMDYGLPSVTACVINDGDIVWSYANGYSDLQSKIPATDETIYHIGSISKLFIVTAIMQLEEKGMINLDEDINLYLPIHFRHPGFPDIPITTRMLLTHRAGLAWPQSFDGGLGLWVDFEPDQAPKPSEWIPQFLVPNGKYYDANLWKPAEPGKYEFYSNIGTCVAAYIVEQISGKDFDDYCREKIFIPLNMLNTSYNYADLDLNKLALLYENRSIPHRFFNNRVYASSGLKTNIRDLGRFSMAYLNKGVLGGNRILEESTVERIFEIQNEASGRCLLWQAYLDGWFGHTGGLILGTATTMAIHLKSGTSLIIFANAHSTTVHPGGEIYGLVKAKANEYVN